MPREFVWPMYFAKRPLKAPRVNLAAGESFPLQDKNYIRGLGASYGVEQASTMPWSELPYVETLNVHSEEFARQIREQGLRYAQAKKLVEQASAEA